MGSVRTEPVWRLQSGSKVWKAALRLPGQHLGMFTEKLEVEHTGLGDVFEETRRRARERVAWLLLAPSFVICDQSLERVRDRAEHDLELASKRGHDDEDDNCDQCNDQPVLHEALTLGAARNRARPERDQHETTKKRAHLVHMSPPPGPFPFDCLTDHLSARISCDTRVRYG